MTDANKRANVVSELGRADDGRDFVLTETALREDLVSCQGFLDRVRKLTAAFLGK